MPKKIRSVDRLFEQLKNDSPGIPPDTCPYLDHILEIVEDLELLAKNNKTEIAAQLQELIRHEIEYIRSVNATLRTSSKYWYDHHKREFYKKNKRK